MDTATQTFDLTGTESCIFFLVIKNVTCSLGALHVQSTIDCETHFMIAARGEGK